MDILLWIIFGGITAWIVCIELSLRSRLLGVIVGVFGAVAAGLAMQKLTGVYQSGINFFSLVVSIAGSLFLVLLLFSGKQGHHKGR